MTEDLKGLLEKIQKDGIQAAEDKAKEIQAKAAKEAELTVENAKSAAAKLISDAKDEIARIQKSSEDSLKNSSRDLLLHLRKEIGRVLDKLVIRDVKGAMSPAELARIITNVIKECSREGEGEIAVTLNKNDSEVLSEHFLGQLKKETQKGIILNPSDEIVSGFVISFDGGKSQFDFTDKAVADFLSKSLKPELAKILNDSLNRGK